MDAETPDYDLPAGGYLITGVLKCIACFSPNYKPVDKEDPEDALAEKIGNNEE